MKKAIVFAVNVAVFLLVLLVLPAFVDVPKLFQYFGQANLLLVVLAAAVYAFSHFMGVIRLGWLFEKMGHAVETAELFRSYMAALFLSDLTPGRIGYSYIVLRLRKNKVPAPVTTKAMGLVLSSDFLVRAGAVLFFAVTVASVFSSQLFWIAALVGGIAVAMFVGATREIRLLTRLLEKVPVFGSRLATAYSQVFSYRIGKKLFAASAGVSLTGMFLRGFCWLLVANALFPQIGFGLAGEWNMSLLAAVATGVSFIPVSLSGFGVVEGVGALFLNLLFGLSLTEAAAVMFLIRAEEFATDLIIGGWGLKGDFQQAVESIAN